MNVSQFNETISRLLAEKLKRYNDKDLNIVTCVEIYQTIFNTLVEVFEIAGTGLTNESMNYLAQQYYDGVLVNGSQELNPNIFTQRAKLENVETKELALLAVMLRGTDFSLPIISEIKRRS